MTSFESCVEEPKPKKDTITSLTEDELSNVKIAFVVEKSASLVSHKKMKAISPQTGIEPQYAYDVDDIIYDKQSQKATVRLTVTWKARKSILGDLGKAEILGELSVDFSNRKSGLISASFIPSQCNEWVKACAKSYDKDETFVLKPITFNPY